MKTTVVVIALLAALLALLAAGSFLYYRRQPVVPTGALHVAMTGRSTMGLWFKHWRWPRPLRWKMTYRSWPFPYSTQVRGDLALLYRPMESPGVRGGGSWGEAMAASFERILATEKFDAAFFKFCFVDYDLAPDQEVGERLAAMQRTVERVRESCARRGIPLVIGNALPPGHASARAVELERRFNTWLDGFAAGREDLRVFDFFSRLAGPDGSLKPELARSADDPHPSDRAFDVLDAAFFAEVPSWLHARAQRSLPAVGQGRGPS